jgi:predicted acyltransferase
METSFASKPMHRKGPSPIAAAARDTPKAASSLGTLPSHSARRVVCVDALRGFTIFWILGGDAVAWSLNDMSEGRDGFWATCANFLGTQLTHVQWEGFRFYDFIFPLLIFVTGISIVLSLPRLVEREGRAAAHIRILRRFFLLFVLGVIYYGGTKYNWPDIRLLGVLQRIALCYLFASLLFLNLRLPAIGIACAFLLIGYWGLMTFVPVPGIGAGSFAPNANLSHWIDAQYLPGRLWDNTSDPEGLLSTLPAIATCLLGVFAGLLLQNALLEPSQKSLWLIGAGVIMVGAGYFWSLQFPIIKHIWTSSFVLVAGGYSMLLLGVLHQITDVWCASKWATIFIWIGANAITLYMANNLINFNDVARRLVGGDIAAFFDDHLTAGAGNFLVAVAGLALAIAGARFLYRRKIFLRV